MPRILPASWLAIALVCGAVAGAHQDANAQQTAKRPLKAEDFARVKNVGDPQISPDGEWIAYTVSTTDLKKDDSDTDVWMVSWDGGSNLRLTFTPGAESSPRWSPDGKYLPLT